MDDVMNKLPAMCAARHPTDNSPIFIKRGEMGYYPVMGHNFDVDGFNERRHISAAQVDAMQIGSMFGWDVPGVRHALELA